MLSYLSKNPFYEKSHKVERWMISATSSQYKIKGKCLEFIKAHISQVPVGQWAKDKEVLFFFNRKRNLNGE